MSQAQTSPLIKGEDTHTTLMCAALEGRTEVVKELLCKGADVNAKDGAGRTALMFAVINLHRETVHALLTHGADVDAKANDGGTALMLAAACGDQAMIEALLNNGASVRGQFVGTNLTANVLAAMRGFSEIVQLLETAGSKEIDG